MTAGTSTSGRALRALALAAAVLMAVGALLVALRQGSVGPRELHGPGPDSRGEAAGAPAAVPREQGSGAAVALEDAEPVPESEQAAEREVLERWPLLKGRVFDRAGAGVPGVELLVGWRREHGPAPCFLDAITDSSGRYAVRIEPCDGVRMQPVGLEHGATAIGVIARSAVHGAGAGSAWFQGLRRGGWEFPDVTLEWQGFVSGRIVDAGGEPMGSGEIFLAGTHLGARVPGDDRSWRMSTEALADGRFVIPIPRKGSYVLYSRSGPQGRLFRPDLKLDPEQNMDLGELVLDPVASIHGRLVDAHKRPVPGAEIEVEFAAETVELEPVVRAVGGFLNGSAVTDEEGRFHIAGLARGPYTLWIYSTDSHEVQATMAGAGVELTWDEVQPEERQLEVWILGAQRTSEELELWVRQDREVFQRVELEPGRAPVILCGAATRTSVELRGPGGLWAEGAHEWSGAGLSATVQLQAQDPQFLGTLVVRLASAPLDFDLGLAPRFGQGITWSRHFAGRARVERLSAATYRLIIACKPKLESSALRRVLADGESPDPEPVSWFEVGEVTVEGGEVLTQRVDVPLGYRLVVDATETGGPPSALDLGFAGPFGWTDLELMALDRFGRERRQWTGERGLSEMVFPPGSLELEVRALGFSVTHPLLEVGLERAPVLSLDLQRAP